MNTSQAIASRIRQLCKQYKITPNALSYRAAVPQSTIKSILNGSANPGAVTIKKRCDGLDITLKEFFGSPLCVDLEQEIR
jgi:Helix-turn-helix.